MGSGLVFKGSATLPPKGQGPSAPQFWGFLSIYAYTLRRRTTKFHTLTHVKTGLVLTCQPHPQPKGTDPRASQFWSFPSIYAYTLCRRNTKFDVVTHVGKGYVYLGVSHASQPKRAQFQRSPHMGLLMYLCL